MAYQAINWQNGVTPLNDTNLNKMDAEISKSSDKLSVDGTEFYFDAKDGVFGWNENAERGADTFHPFNEGGGGGDAIFIPSYIPNGGAKTTDIYTNNSEKDVTLYYCVKDGQVGSESGPYARILVDGEIIVTLASLSALYEGNVTIPSGSTLQVWTKSTIYFIGSFSSLPFEKNVPIEDRVPLKEAIIDCVLPILDVGTNISATGASLLLNRYAIDLSDKTKLTVSARRHPSSSSGTFYIAVYDSKANPTAAQIRTKAQEDGTYHTMVAHASALTTYEFDISNHPKAAYVYYTHNTAGSYTLGYVGEVSFS